MPFKEFQTKWVDVLPTVGLQCPTCSNGFVEGNSFTDKKGKRWESVKCEDCATKWIMSSHSPKSSTAGQIEHKEDVSNEGVELLQKILGYLENIDSNLTTLILKYEGDEAEMTETAQKKWKEFKAA